MSTIRITAPMRRSLESRLEDLDRLVATLDAQREGDDSAEVTALIVQLQRERDDIVDAIRDATLIDDEPFDTEAIEVGDTVTIRDPVGTVERYVLVDRNVGSRARSDWVSVSSPLGAAILGRGKGDRVFVESPVAPTSYVIVDFERASESPVVVDATEKRVRSRVLTPLSSEAYLG